MAIIVCPECGRPISDRAEICPGCGLQISENAAHKTQRTKAAAFQKIAAIIALCATALLGGLAIVYVNMFKQPYEVACADYNQAVDQYYAAVGGFEIETGKIDSENQELDAAIDRLNNLIASAGTPLDTTARDAALNTLAEAEAARITVPDLPNYREWADSSSFSVFQTKDILDETELVTAFGEEIFYALDRLAFPDYSDVLRSIEEAEAALTDSMRLDAQINNPTEAFLLERLADIAGISAVEAAAADNDPDGNLHQPGGYSAEIFFISDMVVNYNVIRRGNTPLMRGIDGGGCIEVYETAAAAEDRNAYLASLDGTYLRSGSHMVYGTLVIRTALSLRPEQQQELEAAIIEALTEVR